MDGPTWNDRFWNAFWYFLLPAVLAVVTVQALATAGVLDEAAPWQYLLAFAVLEVVVLGIRDRVLGARASGPRDFGSLAAEGRDVEREARKLLKKSTVSAEVRAEIDAAIAAVDEAIKKRQGERVAASTRALDELLSKHFAKQRKGTTREYLEAITLAVLVALGIRAFVVEAFKIPSPSMYPTLNVGDNIFVNKFVYGPLVPFTARRLFSGRAPARGEVVVFIYPQDPSKDYIKRVIGLPGDRVRVHPDGTVEVNGRPLNRCEVGIWQGDDGDGRAQGAPGMPQRLYVEWNGAFHYLTLRQRELADFSEHQERTYALNEPYVVPQGHVFVMGDNRDNSYDSRFWGPVPVSNIKGKALWIWWSNLPGAGCGLMRWGRFGQDILGEPSVPPVMREGFDACMRRGPEAPAAPAAPATH